MKNRSFLFLIAALAMGLALFGCSTDSDSTTDYIKQGYAGDAEAIAAAFEFADNVYLDKATTLTGQILTIPAGKTLHVNGQTITVSPTTIIIGAGGLSWDGNDDSKIDAAANGVGAVLIGIDYAAGRYGTNGVAGTASDFTFVPKDGTIVSDGDTGGILATDSTAIFAGGSYLAVNAGTTAYFTGATLTRDAINVAGGTLFVAGNLTGLKSLTTTTPLVVNGKLSGGTVAPAELISGAGVVQARTADITGGQIGNLVVMNGEFGNTTFTDLSVYGRATFTDNVSFTAGSIVNAVFTSGKTVGGNAQVGNISFAGTGKTLVLAANGEIIFTDSTNPSFFTGAGTLAALSESISLTFAADELEINSTGTGAFTVNNDITLKDTNKKIKVTGSAGLYFTEDNNKIEGDGYYFSGGLPGTLSADNYKGFVLTKAGIEGASTEAADRPTLKYTLTNGAGGTFLTILNGEGSLATIKNANISLTTGSIAFEGGGTATLFLDVGGSITASTAVGSLAHSGYIISDAVGGSIVAGSIGGSMSAASITAGSVGTVGNNLILITSEFAIAIPGTDTGSASAASFKASATPAVIDYHGGSVAVFAGN
jgi:hypothetical protein